MLLGLGVYLDLSAIHSKRALFPYNDSCHVNYSAHKVNFPALVATSIVAVSRSQGMHTQYHRMPVSIPCNSDDKENGLNNNGIIAVHYFHISAMCTCV